MFNDKFSYTCFTIFIVTSYMIPPRTIMELVINTTLLTLMISAVAIDIVRQALQDNERELPTPEIQLCKPDDYPYQKRNP